ncbi:hypothetical protein [Clostridium tarantellae]|uniref:Uncharacterized protein n=1 Tax=Clostridium tarantellae TaxID=39493 RepID=A0A6I1MLG1_9CLOT|nr:hypothetical protein [Clostridium tarantellae]MPQ43860.1 hypothetical protein [Clostridium tarantellae]
MKDFKILKLMDKFKGVFEKFGVEYDIMRKILQVKFTMDGRRVPTIFKNSRQNKDKDKNKFFTTLWMYSIIGIFMIPVMFIGDSYMLQMSIITGMFMFMLSTTLISDFSTVLLDIRDRGIILTKPVKSITLSMAKVMHVSIYMFYTSIALMGPMLLISVATKGITFFVISLIEIILINLLIISLTAFIYLLILKFFDGEKLKDIINFVQIILSIVMIVIYQLIGRVFSLIDLKVVFNLKWWHLFLPPIWFAAPYEIILNRDFRGEMILLAALAIATPIILILLYIKLMPTFERNLQKLNNFSHKTKNKKSLLEKLSKYICRNKYERAFLKFSLSIMKTERDFKLKLYPNLSLSFIFPFIFLFPIFSKEGLQGLANTKLYLILYLGSLFFVIGITLIEGSTNYKGAWIYKVCPIKDISVAVRAAFKAYIIKFIIPIFFVQSVLFILIFNIRILPDIIIMFLSIILNMIIYFKVSQKALPFSKIATEAGKSNIGIMFFAMLITGVCCTAHYILLSTMGEIGVYILLVIMILLIALTWKTMLKISWNKIK